MKKKLKQYIKTIGTKFIDEKKTIQKVKSALINELLVKESSKILTERKNGNYIFKNVYVHKGAILESPVTLYANCGIRNDVRIGKFTYINNGTTIFYGSRVGRYCSIGKKCEIGTVDHPIDWLSTSSVSYNMDGHFPKFKNTLQQRDFEQTEGVNIGHDVWIGSLVVVKSGLTIGHGAIVAAGTVVTKDIPPYAIMGGVPAKIIRYRFNEETIEKLLQSKWWEREIEELSDINFEDVDQALIQLDKL